jgi:serine/threonine protein kinase/Flp pilus assembly protein TadD
MTGSAEVSDGGREGVLADAVGEFMAEVRAGRSPSVEDYSRRHPEIAEDLRRILPGMALLVPGNGSPAGAGGEGPTGTLGDYRLVREVGRGGMGVVYEAEQISLSRRVALKVLPFAATVDPRHLQRFQSEARAAAILHHPHIVPVYGVGCDRGMHFYAMQFIDGVGLDDIIAERRQGRTPKRHPNAAGAPQAPAGPAPASGRVETAETAMAETPLDADGREYHRAVARLGRQAADALEYAHSMGVVHRDIKPGNLLLDNRGELWVTDFGLAKLEAETGVTMTGDLLGTLRYMSPEQALADHGLVDHRTDIYALGVTLYEMLTLRPAFEGQDRQRLLWEITAEEPRSPRALDRTIPADLETVVLKAMAKEPADRYPSARELADDLGRYLNDETVLAKRPGLGRRAGKWVRRNRALVTAACTALLLALVGLGVGLGWGLRDRSARLAHAEQKVVLALDEAERFRDDRNWPKAVAAAARARSLLPSDGDEDLQARVEASLKDMRMVVRLEEISLERGAIGEGEIGGLTLEDVDAHYAQAFREFGTDVEMLGPARAGERLQASPVRIEFAGALADWAQVRRQLRGRDDKSWKALLATASRCDPDDWRNRLRLALAEGDKRALKELMDSTRVQKLPVSNLESLAELLLAELGPEAAVEDLRELQRRHPGNFWLNQVLARALAEMSPPRHEEAVGYYRAALAARPNSGRAYVNLSFHLSQLGRLDEAVSCCRESIRLVPGYALAHLNLGGFLYKQRKLPEAVASFREALRLKPDYAEAHNALGIALKLQGKLEEAVIHHQKAVDLHPESAKYHNNLGNVLGPKGEWTEAIHHYEEALRLKPDYPHAHCNLAECLKFKGRFAEALEHYRRGHELGSKLPRWRYPSKRWVGELERLVELDGKLSAVIRGEKEPADTAETIAMADMCARYKRLPAAAASLYLRAFEAEPRLASRQVNSHRYQAARAAAWAGCGGEDAAGLGEDARARWRRQAHDWLRAELTALGKLMRENDEIRAAAAQFLARWRSDLALAGVRDEGALAKLPEEERRSWEELWADIRRTQTEAERPRPEGEPPEQAK